MKQTEQLLQASFVLDERRTANRIMGIREELFILGYAFTARDVITATSATDVYIHFDAKIIKDTHQVVFNDPIFNAGEAGPLIITYYVNPTLTEGGRTAIEPSNRRATSDNQAQATIEFVAAANVSSPGTKFTAQLITSSSGAVGLADVGASTVSGLPFEINAAYDYLVKIDNTNGTDALCEYHINWFEIIK